MRLKVAFYPHEGRVVRPNKHAVQGFIYNMLRGTGYENIHEGPRFKFFTFSDFFTDRKGRPTFIVSSPDRGFIDALHSSLKDRVRVYIGTEELIIAEVRKFRLPLRRRFQTGSPVVIYRDSRRNEYFKLHAHGDLNFFLNRLRENAEKKYNAFYGEDFHLDGPIFDRMIPKLRRNGKLDVYVRVVKEGRAFTVIGSRWELLEKNKIPPEQRRFYSFLMDAGLGEKNSLGFGFINPIGR